jgi:hypothetical protein
LSFQEISGAFKRKKEVFQSFTRKGTDCSQKNAKKLGFFSKNVLHFLKEFAIIHITMGA